MHQQVALVASNAEGGSIHTWDVETCTSIATYKSNSSPRNGFCCLGRDYLLASQTGKGSLHFWSWHKDHVLQRAFTVEPMHTLAATADGAFVAGGGASGAIYVWASGSGQLLRSWPAHYKAVTCLVFTQHSGGLLLSGGEDTVVSTWVLMDVLDASISQQVLQQQPPTPLYSWSEHTLPVTSIHAGAGQANALAVTASLDRSCKIWSLAQGVLLRTLTFPSAIHSIRTDPGDHALYAGSGDGRIFETSLVGEVTSGEGSGEQHEAGYHTMEGHEGAVTCLAMTTDANQLVSGCEDGSVIVWDLRTRQPIRTLQKAGKGSVTGLLVMDRPPFLAAGQGGRGDRSNTSAHGGTSKKGPQRPQPLAPFSKYYGAAGGVKPWEGVPVVIDGCTPYRGVASMSGFASCLGSQSSSPSNMDMPPADTDMCESTPSTNLQAENDKLRKQLQKAQESSQEWQHLHAELHSACVSKLLNRAS
ncbi:hypothetical protein ABBQ38_011961 [Trebouxia sp. C0009 RCD-2024]